MSKAQSEGKGYAYALGTAYVREFVSADVKPEADALVDNLRVAFSELLEENAWMSDETKPLAQEKLDLMVQLVAYDESIMSNEGLDEFYADVRGRKWGGGNRINVLGEKENRTFKYTVLCTYRTMISTWTLTSTTWPGPWTSTWAGT